MSDPISCISFKFEQCQIKVVVVVDVDQYALDAQSYQGFPGASNDVSYFVSAEVNCKTKWRIFLCLKKIKTTSFGSKFTQSTNRLVPHQIKKKRLKNG